MQLMVSADSCVCPASYSGQPRGHNAEGSSRYRGYRSERIAVGQLQAQGLACFDVQVPVVFFGMATPELTKPCSIARGVRA